jgi:hypothetical protein
MINPKEKSLQEIIEDVEEIDEDLLEEMENHFSVTKQDFEKLLED